VFYFAGPVEPGSSSSASAPAGPLSEEWAALSDDGRRQVTVPRRDRKPLTGGLMGLGGFRCPDRAPRSGGH
jgi:hypothetical protein